MASVAASDVSDMSDNNNSNVLNNYNSASSLSACVDSGENVGAVSDSSSDSSVSSLSSVSASSVDNSAISANTDSSVSASSVDNSVISANTDSSASSESVDNSAISANAASSDSSIDSIVSNEDKNSASSIISTDSSSNSYDISSAENITIQNETDQSVKTLKTSTKIVDSGKSVANGKKYYLTLKDSNGKALAGKSVVVKFNGKSYNLTTSSKGLVGLTIKGTLFKTYKLTYKFAGDANYSSVSGSVNITVKNPTKVTDSGSSIVKGNKYTVALKNSKGKALSGRKVVFTINGKTFIKKTNSKGIASLKINLKPNANYTLSYKFAGSSSYAGVSKTVNLFVKIPTAIANTGKSIGRGKTYSLTLKDSAGNPLVGKKVKFTIGRKTYIRTTNSNGVAGLKISLTIGKTYKIYYKYAGGIKYGPCNGSVNVKVKKATNLVAYTSNNITKGTVYKVLLKDSSGKALSNAVVTFKFNGKTFNKKTNSKGIASLTINAQVNKTYSFSYKYAGSTYYASSSSGSLRLAVRESSDSLDNISSTGYSTVTKRGNAAQYKNGLNVIANLTDAELKSYLASSGHDALNTAIKNLANQLVSGKTTTWAKAEAIFNYVRDYVSYSFYSNSRKSASGTLSSKYANCCDQANLVVALCRAAKIPARFSHAQGCRFSSGLVAGHVWAQIYVDGVWYSADATSVRNSLGNIKNWNVNSYYSLKQYAHLPF